VTTECSEVSFDFHPLGSRQVTAQFDGGIIASDGGGVLLREIEKRTGIIRKFAACFRDYRDPDLIEFSVEELLAQRIYALCLGYEDVNDHDELRRDPLLALLVGRRDCTGQNRENPRDRANRWRARAR
jgi:hypothetical protein